MYCGKYCDGAKCGIYSNPGILQVIFKSMRLLLASILLLVLFSGGLALHMTQPLRAMLYCYLPTVQLSFHQSEYNHLAEIINEMLQKKGINVEVEVCDPERTGRDLYDETRINSLFDRYDILQVDVAYLYAITTELVTFNKSEIDYYDEVYGFAWEPTTIEGQDDMLNGSPGLMCSTFIETRTDDDYKKRLYADFSYVSAFGLVDLYLNLYLNNNEERDLATMDYSSVDDQTIAQVADFLKDCQEDNSRFDYQQNWCLKSLTQNFFDTQYERTTGYSENLFNFQQRGIDTGYIEIKHITQGKEKKVFYIDSFIAKEGSDKETVLKFYKFMLSDAVLDLYIKGKYTENPQTTYILPPTISYMKQMASADPTYRTISKQVYQGAKQYPIYHEGFGRGVYNFAEMISQALKNII